jgi:hypothetical protein
LILGIYDFQSRTLVCSPESAVTHVEDRKPALVCCRFGATPLEQAYENQIFSRGKLRASLHLRRFHWLVGQIRRAGYTRITAVDLGCSDGRIVEMIEAGGVQVTRYQGFDANWHKCIVFAREKFATRPELSFTICKVPEEMHPEAHAQIGICMETLEHAPPECVDGYLAILQRTVTDLMFITVPVERGPIFVAKHAAKQVLGINDQEFRSIWSRDFWNQALGRMDRVPRHQHRGFDDRDFVRAVARHFEIISVKGLFLPGFTVLNPNIGIVCRPRPLSE